MNRGLKGKEMLGIGIVGSGFITRFHLQSFVAVRDVEIRGIWSPLSKHAGDAAAFARSLDLGDTVAHVRLLRWLLIRALKRSGY